MREILFRGKRIDNDKWIEGYLFENWGDAYICLGTENGNIMKEEVNEVTAGQYTGLKDKNGKKIFDGDIIKTHFSFTHEVEQEPFIVVWNIDKAMFEGVKPSKRKDEYLKGFDFLAEQKNLYEVIGNIHDNPELL